MIAKLSITRATLLLSLLVLVTTSTTLKGQTTAGLVAYYPLNGDAQDASGNGRHGAPQGSTTPGFAPAQVGQGIVLSGDQYVSLPSFDIPQSFTISTWAKLASTPSTAYMFFTATKTSQGGIYFQRAATQFQAGIYGRSGGTDKWQEMFVTEPQTIGEWFHVALTYDALSKNLILYTNGVQSTVMGGVNPPSGSHGSVATRLGRSHDTDRYLQGSMDEVRVYNRALSAIEIQGVYAGTPPVIVMPFSSVTKVETDTLVITPTVTSVAIPVSYQWQTNGTAIAGQTSQSLQLNNLNLSHSGDYTLVASNAAGAVTSSIVSVQILALVGDTDGDDLSNARELQLGTHPANPDTDGDGPTDYQEVFAYGTNPLIPDTDGDGMPDGWEVANGLNPRVNDAALDADLDGVSNLKEYQSSLNPRNPTTSPGTPDYGVAFLGKKSVQHRYDRLDRLIATEYSTGLTIGYIYDGNGNIVGQSHMSRDGNANGLPDWWELANNLSHTNTAPNSALLDSDGDGYSDYQEYLAKSHPRDTNSIPGVTSVQTAPSAVVLPEPARGGALSVVRIRLWDGEGNLSTPLLEYLAHGSSTWSNATVVSLDGGAVRPVTALPSGSDHELIWSVGADLGAGYTNTVQLRARASDVTLTGNYSFAMPYLVEVSLGNPVANGDLVSISEDTQTDINVLGNDTVQNGLTLSIAAITQPTRGTASVNADKTIRYVPGTNYFGPDSFTYTISDGAGGTNMAVVAVTVVAVNDAPASQTYSFTNTEDNAVVFGWNTDRDVEGDLVSLLSVQANSTAGGLITVNGSVITYRPPTNFTGADSFTFTVQDNGLTGGSPDPKQAVNLVNLEVTPVNDAPFIIMSNAFTLAEDMTLLLTNLSVGDVDAGSAPITLSLLVNHGLLNLGTTNGLTFQNGSTNSSTNLVVRGSVGDLNLALTNLTYRGNSNYHGADLLVLTVNDEGNSGAGGVRQTSQQAVLTLAPVNDLPLVNIVQPTNGAVFLTKDRISIVATAADADGQVSRVEIYAGTNLVGTATTPPYSVSYTNPPAAAALLLTAVAVDNQNGTNFSGGITVEVRLPGLVKLEPPVIEANGSITLLMSNTDIGRVFEIQYSTDLINWTPLTTATNLNGSLTFTDTIPPNSVLRVYRAMLLVH